MAATGHRCDRRGSRLVVAHRGTGLVETMRHRCDRRSSRGEVFPVVILYGGVMLTVLLGVHVTLVSVARTALDAAADYGVLAAQGTAYNPDPDAMTACDELPTPAGVVNEEEFRACAGALAAVSSLNSASSMVVPARAPEVFVNDDEGVVSVITYGLVRSPVLGFLNVTGHACGPLSVLDQHGPTRANLAAC